MAPYFRYRHIPATFQPLPYAWWNSLPPPVPSRIAPTARTPTGMPVGSTTVKGKHPGMLTGPRGLEVRLPDKAYVCRTNATPLGKEKLGRGERRTATTSLQPTTSFVRSWSENADIEAGERVGRHPNEFTPTYEFMKLTHFCNQLLEWKKKVPEKK